ncbi:MAG: B12-binding domain-containing radical SAM protein [Planctomycetes bacterium]|nr:B12-binding domain-containing radical SAM protein [Planctomycetota bacterium]
MKTALIYPPTCDPTAPYLSVPALAAWLRKHGFEVLPVDANLEAWEWLLRPASLTALAKRIEERLAVLERQPALSHVEQLDYAALWAARGDAAAAPSAIEDALATLRDPERFYDPDSYGAAVAVVEAAQRVVSAAHAPLVLDFVSYRTPFSLLSAEEIARDAAPGRDPFHEYFESLAKRLCEAGVGLVGVSVAFPGQIQPAYSLAHVLRERLPGVHVTVGGPALTQMLLRLTGDRLERAIGPFSSAVVFEGEVALLELVRALERGDEPSRDGRLIRGRMTEDLGTLPPPDFDGMPLDRYLAPALVLPYDPTRGCYWGTCTFCHYGLAEVGTARYRQRPVATVLDHLAGLSAKHGAKFIYLSQDVFPPKVAGDIARGIAARGLDLQWGTDMRPEPALDPALCDVLVRGGLLNTALGVESAAPRVLKLIDKGIAPDDVARVVRNLAAAGAAVEAMCFTDFPTESCTEALETVRFCTDLRDSLSLFIVGRFDLTHGSLVAQRPGEFGIREVWQVEGDELGTGLFFAERRRAKNAAQQARVDRAVANLASGWRLRRYPWAGALSTAHTMLWYARHGADVFRTLGPAAAPGVPRARPRTRNARFNVARLARTSAAREAAIWERLVHTDRRVGREAYVALSEAAPRAKPAPGMYRVVSGSEPEPAADSQTGARRAHSGRRPSHAANATRP